MLEKRVLTSGDDALKVLVKGIADVALLVSDMTEGFSLKEVSELIALGQDIQAILSSADLIIPTYEQLEDSDRSDLEFYIVSMVTFPANVLVRDVLVKILQAAVDLSKLFSSLRAVPVA